jgi:hypothetical protein
MGFEELKRMLPQAAEFDSNRKTKT